MARQQDGVPTTRLVLGEGDSAVYVTAATDSVANLLGTGGFRLAEGEADPRPADVHNTDERPKGNATREAWAAYATANEVEFDEDAQRADIIEAVDAAGL